MRKRTPLNPGFLLFALIFFLAGCRSAAPSPAPPSPTASALTPTLAPSDTPPSAFSARDGNIRFRRFSIEQGLSQSSIHAILQDREGFLWFGTEDGLNRYDGYQVTVFKHDPEDPASLSNNNIQRLYQDHAGVLWVGMQGGGLDRYDPASGSFIHFRHDPSNESSLSSDMVLFIFEDRQYRLWVGTARGLNRLDPASGAFTHYQHDPKDPESLSGEAALSIFEDSRGRLWVVTSKGLDMFDFTEQAYDHVSPPGESSESMWFTTLTPLIENKDGAFWMGTSHGLARFDPSIPAIELAEFQPFTAPAQGGSAIRAIHEDQAGDLWIGAFGGGLAWFDPESGGSLQYRHDPQNQSSLSNDYIYYIQEDRSGLLWIGTFGGGTNIFDRRQERFAHYYAMPGKDGSLSQNTLFGMAEDAGGNVWIATFGGGVARFDPRTGLFEHYRHDPQDPESLSDDETWSIYVDRSGDVWVGTSSGLDRLDTQTGKFTHYKADRNDPTTLQSSVVRYLVEDRQGILYAATDNGLSVYQPESDSFRTYKHDPADPSSQSHEQVWTMLVDSQDRLWLGTNGGGLNRFDRQTGKFTRYTHDPKDPASLSHDSVLAIAEDRSGRIWVGTWSGGLNLLDEAAGTFAHYTEKDGLPNNVIYAILEDDQGSLWLSTNNGLSRFDPQQESFQNFTAADGLQSNEFNLNSALETQRGEFFFGGINGLTAFFPHEITSASPPPPVVISAISLFNRPLQAQMLEDGQLRLDYQANFLSFDFTVLDFRAAEKNQYAYMLEGLDDGWVFAGTRRHADYPDLDPGSYTFRVKGANSEGVWNEQGASLAITISPPIWQTSLFQIAVFLLLGGAAFTVYRFRLESEKASRRQLELQVVERTKTLAGLNRLADDISLSLDLPETLTVALDHTMSLMEVDSGGIVLLDEASGRLRIAVQRGLGAGFVQAIEGEKTGGSLLGEVVRSGQTRTIRDLAEDAGLARQVGIAAGMRSAAAAPLTSKRQVLGALFVATRGLHTFRPHELDLLSAIGQQTGVAVENARLYEATRTRLAQVTALQETNRALVSTLELDALLDLIIQQAVFLLQGEGGILNLTDWNRGEDQVVAVTGISGVVLGSWASLEDSLSGWATLNNQPVISNNLRDDPRTNRSAMDMDLGVPMVNAVVAPLAIKDRVTGTLVVIDKLGGKGEFNDEDLNLLMAFASQAATAIENARLYSGEHSRAEQFRVIGELGRQLATILEVDVLLQQVVQAVKQAFGHYHVAIGLVEGDDVVYRYGAGELWDDPEFGFNPSRLKVGKEGMTGWVAASGEALLAPDVRQEPHYVWMQGSRTLSELTVPILVKGQVTGVLDLQSDRLNAFDETDRVVAQLLANQTGAALENARLFADERRRAEQFRVISEVSRQIVTALNEQELLEQLAGLIQSSFGYTHVGIGLVQNGYVVSRAEVGAYASRYQGSRTALGEGCWGRVAESGQALLLNSAKEVAAHRSEAADAGVQSHLCVPLIFKDSNLGVLSAQSDAPGAFDASDQIILQSLASQAAVALENLRAQSRAQQLAVIEERNRLARELHDAVTQTLFSASLIAEALPASWEHDPGEGRELLQELRSLSRGALAEMRTLLLELRPAALAETSLADLLRQLAEAASGREGIPVRVSVQGQGSLPVDVHIALYRIAQEALNNVVKHARASEVQVRLCYTYSGDGRPLPARHVAADLDGVLLAVQDNGCGFDASQARLNRLGLGIMQERAQAIGASLQIESAPGKGTLVAVAWQPEKKSAPSAEQARQEQGFD